MTTNKKPELLALLLCERAILEEDKVPTLFRIVDTFTITLDDTGMTDEERKTLVLSLECWVFTKWGLGYGEFTEQLGIMPPQGQEIKFPKEINFSLSGFRFHQTRAHLAVAIREPGLYHIRVYLDNEFIREHPFMVNIVTQKLVIPPTQG